MPRDLVEISKVTVIWSGTLERQAIEAQRRPAPPLISEEQRQFYRTKFGPKHQTKGDRIVALLESRGPMTRSEIAGVLQSDIRRVRALMDYLRDQGRVIRTEQ